MVLLLVVLSLVMSTKSKKEMGSYSVPVALVTAALIDIFALTVIVVLKLLFNL